MNKKPKVNEMQVTDNATTRPQLLIENKPEQVQKLLNLGLSPWTGNSPLGINDLSNFVVSRSREAFEALVGHSSSTNATANFQSVRSVTPNQTKILVVAAEMVQRYVHEITELKSGVDCFDWRNGKKPEIIVDLSGFTVQGDLEASVENVIFLLRQTTFEGSLKLGIAGLVELKFHNSTAHDIQIHFSGRGHLRVLEIEKSSWNGCLEIQGLLQRPIDNSLITNVTFSLKPGNTFAGPVTLSKCELAELILNRWTFSDDVQLNGCRIPKFGFLSTTLRGQLTFVDCFFVRDPALFLNAIFEKPTLFSGCTFVRAPDFHGAKLHQNTRFSTCTFRAAGSLRWPKSESVDVASYRVLKGHFGQQKDSRQEIAFYALEQRAERHLSAGDPVERGISWIQDAVSGYGQSLSRAVYVFFGWNAAFGAVFQLFANEALKIKANGSIAAFPGFVLALQNAFNPLALFSDKGLVEMNSLYLYLASLLQALGSIGIVTLILLTMRGKFRKGSSSEG